jgi:hypothetical protein
MTLGSTQPLTEISARKIPGGKGQPAHKVENINAICELTGLENEGIKVGVEVIGWRIVAARGERGDIASRALKEKKERRYIVKEGAMWHICPMQELLSHRNLETRTQQ